MSVISPWRRRRALAGAGALVMCITVGAPEARAALTTPSQWQRPMSDVQASAERTTYQEWNLFGTPAGPNNPDVAEVNPNPGAGPNASKANVYTTSAGGFVTGGGNIYSPTAALVFRADVPGEGLGSGFTTTVLFQVRTLGSELSHDSVRLTYDDGTQRTIPFVARQELERIALGGQFGGSQVDTLYSFALPYSPESFTILFDAAASSVSLDRVAIDSFAAPTVPEPASAAVLAAAGLLGRRRRV